MSSETIFKIFSRIEDHSIRGKSQTDNGVEYWKSTVCLLYQDDAIVFGNNGFMEGVTFILQNDTEEKAAAEVYYNIIKTRLQSFKPQGWVESEMAPLKNKYYFIKDKMEKPSKEIKLNLQNELGKSSVRLIFSYFVSNNSSPNMQNVVIPKGLLLHSIK